MSRNIVGAAYKSCEDASVLRRVRGSWGRRQSHGSDVKPWRVPHFPSCSGRGSRKPRLDTLVAASTANTEEWTA
eukprot:227593-Prorocentrum_minimum.AAC.1